MTYFFALGDLGDRAPLEAGGKARAAAPAQAALDHRLDDVLGRHFAEHFMQGLIAVRRDVALDALRINHAAVGQHDGQLPFEKRPRRDRVCATSVLPPWRAATREGAFSGVTLIVEGVLRVGLDQRAFAAQFHAADAAHFHLVLQARRPPRPCRVVP